jgi:flagellar basal body-associated protein FliL
MKRKAQGLSLNTIIIAALVLLVLVVLAIVFGTRAKFFTGQTANCEAKGGECSEKACGAYIPPIPELFGYDENTGKSESNCPKYCCMDLLNVIENK